MNFIFGLIVGLFLSLPQSDYKEIEVKSMTTGQSVKVEIDPMVFVIEPAGQNVYMHYKTRDKAFTILMPLYSVIDLRKEY